MSGRPEDTTNADPGTKTFRHIPALDGLRGLAVAAVVLYHFAPDLSRYLSFADVIVDFCVSDQNKLQHAK